MRITQWYNESKELSEKRLDMLSEKLSINEMIEYRENYRRNRKLISKMMMVFELVIIFSLLILCILEDLSVVKSIDMTWGYLFGFGIAMLVFIPSGSYERKLTERIEKKSLRELELRK